MKKYGGERGIRTLGAAFDSTHDFQSCSFGQLGHLSENLEGSAKFFKIPSYGGEGGIRTHDPVFDRIPLFESGALSRSATSPTSSIATYRLNQYNFLIDPVNNLVLFEADSSHTFCGSFVFIT